MKGCIFNLFSLRDSEQNARERERERWTQKEEKTISTWIGLALDFLYAQIQQTIMTFCCLLKLAIKYPLRESNSESYILNKL